MKLKNTTNGPKAVNTTDRGSVILQPGEEADLNVSDADAKALKATGLLDGEANAEAPSLATLQREIASGATPEAMTAEADADAADEADADADADEADADDTGDADEADADAPARARRGGRG